MKQLTLKRRIGEAFWIGGDIRICLAGKSASRTILLEIGAPAGVPVVREELIARDGLNGARHALPEPPGEADTYEDNGMGPTSESDYVAFPARDLDGSLRSVKVDRWDAARLNHLKVIIDTAGEPLILDPAGAHRLDSWLLRAGPGARIDRANGDRLDLRRANLITRPDDTPATADEEGR